MNGKTVIVTGASRGIGLATALTFAEAGAKVALAARSLSQINDIAAQITNDGGEAIAVECDVSQFQSVAALISKTEDRFGPVDVLVNNAGVIEPIEGLAKGDPEAWSNVIDINLKGVYYGMRAVLPGMIERGDGTIITVGSGAAHNALEGWSHYCASKAGALMLNLSGHKEAGELGVTCINLSPGTVATEMQVAIKKSGVNPVSELDPSVHIPADWPAKAIVWLSGPGGKEFAGQEVSLRDARVRELVGLN